MNWRIRNKQAARKATIAAQAAACVLVVSGGAMAVFGQRILKVEPPVLVPTPPQPEEQAEGGAGGTGRSFDPVVVSENLGAIGNAPVPDPKPEEAAAGNDLQSDPSDDREIRYVGSVQVGERAAAFLNIAGATRLLRLGQTYEGVRLVSVEGGQVVISVDGGDEQTVEKSERQGPAVSVLVGGAPGPVAATPVVSSEQPPTPASFTPNMSREERRAALIERARDERARWDRQRGDGGGGPPDRNQR